MLRPTPNDKFPNTVEVAEVVVDKARNPIYTPRNQFLAARQENSRTRR